MAAPRDEARAMTRCARCRRVLTDGWWVYSKFTRAHYCPPDRQEECKTRARLLREATETVSDPASGHRSVVSRSGPAVDAELVTRPSSAPPAAARTATAGGPLHLSTHEAALARDASKRAREGQEEPMLDELWLEVTAARMAGELP